MTAADKIAASANIMGAALLVAFALLFVAERAFPLRRRKRKLARRVGINLVVTALGFAAAALVVKPVTMSLAARNAGRPFGLLHLVDAPLVLKVAAGFLLMDLTFYWWHRAAHTFGPIWRLHNVHHFDPDLDVSTSFRFHFVEIALSAAFRAAQVFVLGITPLILLVYEAAFLAATMFHHSNLRLPLPFERTLNKVFVTPRMHGIHHSVVKEETNSNYSSVFRWWDALHGTLVLDVPQDEIRIGVPAYMLPDTNRLGRILASPFRKQKDYWRWPNGKTPQRAPGGGAAPVLAE